MVRFRPGFSKAARLAVFHRCRQAERHCARGRPSPDTQVDRQYTEPDRERLACRQARRFVSARTAIRDPSGSAAQPVGRRSIQGTGAGDGERAAWGRIRKPFECAECLVHIRVQPEPRTASGLRAGVGILGYARRIYPGDRRIWRPGRKGGYDICAALCEPGRGCKQCRRT